MYDPESGSIYTCPCNSEQEVFETFTDLFRSWTEFEEYDYYVDRFDEDDIREEKDYLYNLVNSGEIIADIDTIKRIFEIASWDTLGGIGFSVIDHSGKVWFSYGCRGISER
jgi:hypothetical protein